MTWLPMETAQRDGTRIIGWFNSRAIVVFWRSGPEYFRARATGRTIWYWSDGYSRFPEPHCWQPEPDPPESYRCDFCEMDVLPAAAEACRKSDCPARTPVFSEAA